MTKRIQRTTDRERFIGRATGAVSLDERRATHRASAGGGKSKKATQHAKTAATKGQTHNTKETERKGSTHIVLHGVGHAQRHRRPWEVHTIQTSRLKKLGNTRRDQQAERERKRQSDPDTGGMHRGRFCDASTGNDQVTATKRQAFDSRRPGRRWPCTARRPPCSWPARSCPGCSSCT